MVKKRPKAYCRARKKKDNFAVKAFEDVLTAVPKIFSAGKK